MKTDPVHIRTITFKENWTAYLGFFTVNHQPPTGIFHRHSVPVVSGRISDVFMAPPSPDIPCIWVNVAAFYKYGLQTLWNNVLSREQTTCLLWISFLLSTSSVHSTLKKNGKKKSIKCCCWLHNNYRMENHIASLDIRSRTQINSRLPVMKRLPSEVVKILLLL